MKQEITKVLQNWSSIIASYKKPNTTKAVIQILNSFLPFFALWVLMYFSLSWSYLLTLGLAIVNAFFLVRIFIIQHDCGHYSFFKSKKWNNIVGFCCSFFSTIPFQYWARVHSYHHGHTGQLEHRDIGDINFLTVKEFQKLKKWGRFKYRIFRNPIVLFFVVPSIYLTVSNRLPIISFQGWKKVHLAQLYNNIALVLLYLGLAYFLGWKNFLLIQLPIVFFFGTIAFWFFYVQHQHEKTYMQWKDNWDYLLAAMKGASYYKLPKLVNWLTGNIGFHHIHHLSHRIPNYNLQKCAKENPILQEYATTLSFKDSLKTVFNKLWDEEKERMISFKEFYQMEKAGLLLG